ncbi:hypothetical protein BH23ACT5_BH23ACT5_11760 [soil metagenome]
MTDSLTPDEVISPHPEAPQRMVGLARDLALMLPNIVKLLGRLVRDPRVPRRSKLLVGGVLVYMASPVDLIPDAIPVVGLADDLLLAAYAVNHLLSTTGEEVVSEHWDGPEDVLELVRNLLTATSEMIPRPLKRWVDRLTG